MNRRQVVQRVAWLVGGAVIGGELFIQTGCKPAVKEKATEAAAVQALPDFFTKEEIALLDEIAETIIPKTTTPGAKDAKVGEFMNVMVRDCYPAKDQQAFKAGLQKIEQKSKDKYKAGFMQIQPAQRKELLIAIDKEARDFIETDEFKAEKENLSMQENMTDSTERVKGNFGYVRAHVPPHYFSMMKQLTLLGFFTSEPGATKALRYAAVPGKYEPCIPYKKGDKAWAT